MAILAAGCAASDDEADLRRYAAEGNVSALAAYVDGHFDVPKDSSHVLLALDLLARSEAPEAAQALQDAVVEGQLSGLDGLVLERANTHGRRFPDPVELFHVYAGTAIYREGASLLAALVPGDSASPYRRALHLTAGPEDWATILREALDYLGEEEGEAPVSWSGTEPPRWALRALHRLRAYVSVAGPGHVRLPEAIRALEERVALNGDLSGRRRARVDAQGRARAAHQHRDEIAERMPEAYVPRRLFVVADLGRRSDGVTTYEVAFPDVYYPGLPSEARALLLTPERFSSRGWATVTVAEIPPLPMRVRDELGGFEQSWPAYVEVTAKRLNELREAGRETEETERTLALAQQEEAALEAEAGALVERARSCVGEVIEALLAPPPARGR